MKKTTRTPNQQAVAQSLRELDKLFGRRPDRKDKSHGEVAFISTAEIKLQANDSTKSGGEA